jgi:addiction module HigA family antidote
MSIGIDELGDLNFSDVAEVADGKLAPVHPGEILLEEFLLPMGITQHRLAKEIDVPQRRIGEIVAGKRAITPDIGLRLSRYFGLNDGFWVGLQTDYDVALARATLGEALARIQPRAAA